MGIKNQQDKTTSFHLVVARIAVKTLYDYFFLCFELNLRRLFDKKNEKTQLKMNVRFQMK